MADLDRPFMKRNVDAGKTAGMTVGNVVQGGRKPCETKPGRPSFADANFPAKLRKIPCSEGISTGIAPGRCLKPALRPSTAPGSGRPRCSLLRSRSPGPRRRRKSCQPDMPCYPLFLDPAIGEFQWLGPDLFSFRARARAGREVRQTFGSVSPKWVISGNDGRGRALLTDPAGLNNVNLKPERPSRVVNRFAAD